MLKFDRITGTLLENYNSTNSPLEDNCVLKITKGANGNLWLATTIGIVKFATGQVGVKDLSDNVYFSVSPNPSEGCFHFLHEGNPDLTYKIYSMDGTFVKDGETTSNTFEVN